MSRRTCNLHVIDLVLRVADKENMTPCLPRMIIALYHHHHQASVPPLSRPGLNVKRNSPPSESDRGRFPLYVYILRGRQGARLWAAARGSQVPRRLRLGPDPSAPGLAGDQPERHKAGTCSRQQGGDDTSAGIGTPPPPTPLAQSCYTRAHHGLGEQKGLHAVLLTVNID